MYRGRVTLPPLMWGAVASGAMLPPTSPSHPQTRVSSWFYMK